MPHLCKYDWPGKPLSMQISDWLPEMWMPLASKKRTRCSSSCSLLLNSSHRLSSLPLSSSSSPSSPSSFSFPRSAHDFSFCRLTSCKDFNSIGWRVLQISWKRLILSHVFDNASNAGRSDYDLFVPFQMGGKAFSSQQIEAWCLHCSFSSVECLIDQLFWFSKRECRSYIIALHIYVT